VMCWMALVVAALARYLATNFAPAWRDQWMIVSVVGAVGVMYYALLRPSQRA
jgi:hypothetical protein